MYASLREQEAFRNVEFMIDSAHWPNHTACSSSLSARNYPARVSNSAAAEQFNKPMSTLRGKVSYMKQPNALLTLLYAVYLLNRKTMERQEEGVVYDLVHEGDTDIVSEHGEEEEERGAEERVEFGDPTPINATANQVLEE